MADSYTLKVLQGPLTGQSFPLIEGLQFGRKKGQVRLNDTKVSGLHAEVQDEDGQLVLVDLESKNGIRVGAHRKERVILGQGTRFSIGDNVFEVINNNLDEKAEQPDQTDVITRAFDQATPTNSLFDSGTRKTTANTKTMGTFSSGSVTNFTRFQKGAIEPSGKEEVEKRQTWNEFLAQWAQEKSGQVANTSRVIAPFAKAISLKFIRGLQADTEWILGYGPRIAGPESMDLPIFEPNAPEPCFELFPTLAGVQFKTEFPDLVKLNGEEISSEQLKNGDQITVIDSLIEVEFLDDQN